MGSTGLGDDRSVVQRILDHIDEGTTDLGEESWREPVAHYRSEARLAAELGVIRRLATPLCPSAALDRAGAYVACDVAGTPLLAVRGDDGVARVFRNACRHRGTQLVEGSGHRRAFACPYHAWTYALDGSLRHVPQEHGFPGLEKASRGLVPVASFEAGGLVFAAQRPPGGEADEREALPAMVPAGYRLVGCEEQEVPTNWKILVEGFLEGYHIRATHAGTFYPLQYDNLNVVERFGRNNRIAFPYRAVEGLREVPPAERTADGRLTYVYHLFPNAVVATFPGRIILARLDPLSIERTRQTTFVLSDQDEDDARAREFLERGRDLVQAGTAEDQAIAVRIQRGLASDANAFFEFGLFEAAIVDFHRALGAALGESD